MSIISREITQSVVFGLHCDLKALINFLITRQKVVRETRELNDDRSFSPGLTHHTGLLAVVATPAADVGRCTGAVALTGDVHGDHVRRLEGAVGQCLVARQRSRHVHLSGGVPRPGDDVDPLGRIDDRFVQRVAVDRIEFAGRHLPGCDHACPD